jgi:hypothetical protein
MVPDLDRVDAVPVRALTAREQEIDGGGEDPSIDRARVAERLAIVPTFRMRLERQQADHVGGAQGRHERHQAGG